MPLTRNVLPQVVTGCPTRLPQAGCHTGWFHNHWLSQVAHRLLLPRLCCPGLSRENSQSSVSPARKVVTGCHTGWSHNTTDCQQVAVAQVVTFENSQSSVSPARKVVTGCHVATCHTGWSHNHWLSLLVTGFPQGLPLPRLSQVVTFENSQSSVSPARKGRRCNVC